jgi:hypothetical protein
MPLSAFAKSQSWSDLGKEQPSAAAICTAERASLRFRCLCSFVETRPIYSSVRLAGC